jgi:hypothetical protein
MVGSRTIVLIATPFVLTSPVLAAVLRPTQARGGMGMFDERDRIPVQYKLPRDLVVRLKKRAADEGRRYSDLAQDAITAYLASDEAAGGKRRRASRPAAPVASAV